MNDMVRVLHLADLHFGPRHLAWIDRAMAHAVDTGIGMGCNLAIIAGDSFDSALNVHEPAFTAYVRQVVRLAKHMPVLVLQGTHSHDRPGSLDVLDAIPSEHPIIVGDYIGACEMAGAMVHILPSLNKADPAIMAMGANAWTAKHLGDIGLVSAAARVSGIPTILVTHGTVVGCSTESGYAMISPDHEFSSEVLASADCDAVMLGHIHAHQSWPNVRTPSGGSTTIAYPGSLARLVHGHHDPVGFLIWDIDPGRACFTFYESPAQKFIERTFTGPPDMDQLRALAEQAGPDDAVRIRWEIDEEHAAGVDKAMIRALFAGANSVKLEPRVLPVQRVRAAGIGKAMTLADKLRYWAETTGSTSALERLTDRLEMLLSMDPDGIVTMIVDQEAP